MNATRLVTDADSAPSPETSQERLARLERLLAARDETIASLIDRVDARGTDLGGAFVVMQRTVALEEVVTRKTRELETERAQLSTALDELKNTQSRLMQAEKMQSIGQLAAGIAHEINTPTQYVSDNVTFLKRVFPQMLGLIDVLVDYARAGAAGELDAEQATRMEERIKRARLDYIAENVPSALEQSLEGLQRITTIVRAMKDFSHSSQGEKELASLADIISVSITVARNEWKYIAELETEFAPDLPEVPCLRDEIGQVILNLVVNAAHAIVEANKAHPSTLGKIVVSTHRAGDFAEVRVRDSGTGIPEHIRNRVFDPFFTTKGVGKGTGQGLAIAYNIVVEKHGGQIGFDTEDGKGSTFIVRLPLKAPPVATP